MFEVLAAVLGFCYTNLACARWICYGDFPSLTD